MNNSQTKNDEVRIPRFVKLNDESTHFPRRMLRNKKISSLPPRIASSVFALLDITRDEEDDYGIRIIDEKKEDDLILVHYFLYGLCVAHVRGLVIDIGVSPPKIIGMSFPFVEEVLRNSHFHMRRVIH